MFSKAMNARFSMAQAKLGFDAKHHLEEAERMAQECGIEDYFRHRTLPKFFDSEPVLIQAWELGAAYAAYTAEYVAQSHDFLGGTKDEWDALTLEEQQESWESFHGLCAQGRGEEHDFYSFLMNKWLVGYAGH